MKMIVKAARKSPKNDPAMPSTPEIASGTDTETCCAPSCTFPAAPESPSQESSSASRSCSTVAGSSCRKSRTLPTSGTSSKSMSADHGERAPDHGDSRGETPRHARLRHYEAEPDTRRRARGRCRRRRSGRCRPIAANATARPSAPSTRSTVRIGRRSSTRRRSPSLMPAAPESSLTIGSILGAVRGARRIIAAAPIACSAWGSRTVREHASKSLGAPGQTGSCR